MVRRGRKTKLDTKTQKRICSLLSNGATDVVVCADVGITAATFYNWLSRGNADGEGEFFDFFEAVTRARAKAHITATKAFYSGLVQTKITEKVTESLSETRLDKAGKPYTYNRESTHISVRTMPPDWRAGEAWLKRRDRDNWSEKAIIAVEDWRSQAIAEIKAGFIEFDALAEAFDLDLATELFKAAGVPVTQQDEV